jgi:hypothetical protein
MVTVKLRKKYRTKKEVKKTSYKPRAGNSNKGKARQKSARVFPSIPKDWPTVT